MTVGAGWRTVGTEGAIDGAEEFASAAARVPKRAMRREGNPFSASLMEAIFTPKSHCRYTVYTLLFILIG